MLVSTLIFLFTQSIEEKSTIIVQSVDIQGNKLLSKADYLKFVSMTEFPAKEKIAIAVIKDRFSKHPYVQNARIEVHSDKSLTVHLEEKEIVANILIEGEMFFYTINRQVVPHLKNSRMIDFPLIMTDRVSKKSVNKVLRSENLENCLQVIFASKIYSQELYQKISQIFSSNEELKIALSNLDSEIFFNPNSIPSNIIALSEVVEKLNNNSELKQSFTKIDFRFEDHIFLIKKELVGI